LPAPRRGKFSIRILPRPLRTSPCPYCGDAQWRWQGHRMKAQNWLRKRPGFVRTVGKSNGEFGLQAPEGRVSPLPPRSLSAATTCCTFPARITPIPFKPSSQSRHFAHAIADGDSSCPMQTALAENVNREY
jgi:hypothetical protein